MSTEDKEVDTHRIIMENKEVDPLSLPRLRTLTTKGDEHYTSKVEHFRQRFDQIRSDIDRELLVFRTGNLDFSTLIQVREQLQKLYSLFVTNNDVFAEFLRNTRTSESQEELFNVNKTAQSVKELVNSTINAIDEKLKPPSSRSKKSSSVMSTSSSMLLKQKYKAESAKAALEFAQKEANLMKEKAHLERKRTDLETDLKLLSVQKESILANAELKCLYEQEESQYSSNKPSQVDNHERVHDYVHDQNNILKFQENKSIQSYPQYESNAVDQGHLDGQSFSPFQAQNHPQDQVFPISQCHPPSQGQVQPVFQVPPSQGPNSNNNIQFGDISKYLIRKELLVSRLSKFDEKPESFLVWKTTFRSVMDETGVNASEEFDLLVKWLGPESAKHATSLRSSSAGNPTIGLERLWNTLDQRYGGAEMVESALKNKLSSFPKLTYMFKDRKKFFDLSDVLYEIQTAKENAKYSQLLSYFDSSTGVIPIVSKLPPGMQNKWREKATQYKKRHESPFPPFTFFVDFIRDQASMLNDPAFAVEYDNTQQKRDNCHKPSYNRPVVVNKTAVSVRDESPLRRCIIHRSNHSLNECKAFKNMSYDERRKVLREHGVCYRCCTTSKHFRTDCKAELKCMDCGSSRHSTAMHIQNYVMKPKTSSNHGGERLAPLEHKSDETLSQPASDIVSKCTEICKGEFSGKSCAKIVPINISHINSNTKSIRAYAVIDDQSNKTLARKGLFDKFNIKGESEIYTLASCAGRVKMSGRRAKGFIVESLDGESKLELPNVIECDEIPNNRDEIPTPDVALHYHHLHSIADQLIPLDMNSDILLLIGRDLPVAHHIIDQKIGPSNEPYAQKLKLGWVVVGETCLGGLHAPNVVNTMKTFVKIDGRASIMDSCENDLFVKEHIIPQNSKMNIDNNIGDSIFRQTKDDDKPAMSIEDKEFLKLMDAQMYQDKGGNWVAPLPFRDSRPKLSNNRSQALYRATSLELSLKKDPVKKEHFFTFMQALFDNNHAELAPQIGDNEECWYLPLFGVYHPKKKDQIRGVFDASATFKGHSLNSVLLTGPDLTNNLVGVLMRFRKESVAITADIKQMFYCFLVRPDHRNYLRFLWYRDNDFEKELVEYRMRVHVFGNSPSPAVATYGLRKATQVTEDDDVKAFVNRNFYVDDALSSHDNSSKAVDLLKRTQSTLKSNGHLHLHKISSNSEEVLMAFPSEELAKGLINIDLQSDTLPLQRSLGLIWDINQDTFKFQISDDNKPFTRRGVLSLVNSIFDPLGFIAPVTVQGKLLLRKFMSNGMDWDEPFEPRDRIEWETWKDSLMALESLQLPRTYVSTSPSQASRRELHIFCDASEKAIAAVAYIRVIEPDGISHLGFLYGKSKVAPVHGHTIPRLELCAAVLAVEITEFAIDQLDLDIEEVKFYSDSKVVLGYIKNEQRRFYVYVANRVERIRKFSRPEQWHYVPTKSNPADEGTRHLPDIHLENSTWLQGPVEFLNKNTYSNCQNYELVDPDVDSEVRPEKLDNVNTLKTEIVCSDSTNIGTKRFENFSTWRKLVNAIAFLKSRARHVRTDHRNVADYTESEQFIIKSVQQEVYSTEKAALIRGENISKNSSIIELSPYIDEDNIMRVGGRLNMGKDIANKNPIILPGKHHVSTLIVRHYHDKVKHMGRHFTEGAVRSSGIWITGGKRLISSILHKCITCRKLRGKVQFQKMADLPEDRLEPAPPFSNVGLDAFGPWPVITRKTRGGQANSKRWAIIFTCLVTRAIHIEVVDEMSSSAFINALRRFIAIRGNVKLYRSDRGTNFIGSTDSLRIDSINVEDGPIKDFLFNSGSIWCFNSPHSSHMGGVWERMIGVTRRILDSMLLEMRGKNLTHDVLATLMAEVCSIVNARPLVPVSNDCESPFVLSPATLLTMKTEHSVKSFTMEDFGLKDLYKNQWRQVQCLANQFWTRWKQEYLCNLQSRRKWQDKVPNLTKGDVVLLKDKTVHRNEWPLGIVENPICSSDGHVRKTEIRIAKDRKVFTRPVTEIVLLL